MNEVYAHAVLGKHPHVVRYYSAWAENDHMFIQNEFCEGKYVCEFGDLELNAWRKVINNIWVATQQTEPYIGKITIEFCIACSRGYSVGHFGTKIMYLAQFLTELLRILSFITCIMKN